MWKLIFLLTIPTLALEMSEFAGVQVQTLYSPKLEEKNAKADSLLPPVDGDAEFGALLKAHPHLWSIQRIDATGNLTTTLEVQVVYLDGNREDAFCELDKLGRAGKWKLRMGLDFNSAASSGVAVHVQQCLERAKAEWGYHVKRGNRVVEIPARKVLEEAKKHKIQSSIDPALQAELLHTHLEVGKQGQCPQDIAAYAMLLDVWDQVKSMPMDFAVLNDHLNPQRNGGRVAHSCAFSREWNARYSEEAELLCNESELTCKYLQEEDGTTRWALDPETDRLVFQPLQILFLSFGGKSIHQGGTILDLRILPLSSQMFLEAYLDEKGNPASLGLVTIPADE